MVGVGWTTDRRCPTSISVLFVARFRVWWLLFECSPFLFITGCYEHGTRLFPYFFVRDNESELLCVISSGIVRAV